MRWTEGDKVRICEGYDIACCGDLDDAIITRIEIPIVPNLAYEEVEASVGGVGKHTRWKVLRKLPKSENARVQVVLHGTFDVAQRNLLDTFVMLGEMSYIPDMEQAFMEDKESLGKQFCTVVMSSDSGAQNAMLLADLGVECASMQEESLREVQISPERIDRAHHQWLRQFTHQVPGKIGPLRCVDNWHQNFLPDAWERVFTWHDICNLIILETGEDHAIDALSTLPTRLARSLREELQTRITTRLTDASLHLNTCVRDAQRAQITAHAVARAQGFHFVSQEAQGDGEFKWAVVDRIRDSAWADRRRLAILGNVSNAQPVRSSLTNSQNHLLLTCWYVSMYMDASGQSRDVIEACRLVLFRAFLHGWFVRVVGKYERTGKHIGFGTAVRKFGATSEMYNSHRQTSRVQNRVADNEGRFRGIAPLLRHARNKTGGLKRKHVHISPDQE